MANGHEQRHPLIGEIAFFAGPFMPLGWLFCDGRLLPTGSLDYEMLFALIGNKYGGDGQNTFAMPAIPDPIPGVRAVMAYAGIFPQPGAPPSPPLLRGFAMEWSGEPPEDTVRPTGQIYKIADNPPLFGLLGTKFGGDDRAGTFALPNLGEKWILNTTGSNPLRS
jgi:microcystin-dependent protein